MCQGYEMRNIALLFCPCGVPQKKSTSTVFRYERQISSWQTLSLRYTSHYPWQARLSHWGTQRLWSAVISSCSTYMLATRGSDCFSLCGCSISNICILHPHLKHLNIKTCSSCIAKSLVCLFVALKKHITLCYSLMCVQKHISTLHKYLCYLSKCESSPFRDGF